MTLRRFKDNLKTPKQLAAKENIRDKSDIEIIFLIFHRSIAKKENKTPSCLIFSSALYHQNYPLSHESPSQYSDYTG